MECVATISVAQTAQRIGVSLSTVRNWIRAGELERGSDGGVTLRSIERCEQEHLGRSRLVARANKRYKRDEGVGGDGDGSCYDESLSEAHRNREGVYYTPRAVARDMLSHLTEGETRESLSEKRLLDPCCGSGNFLVEALDMGFRAENIYGYDIDPEAVKIARRRLYEKSGVRMKNIVCRDFLMGARSSRRYDYVVTNPPWGKKMSQVERRELSARYGVELRSDSSSTFLMAAMGVLRDGGSLSFLVQEALFSVRSHESLRKYLLDYEVYRLVDYGRVFTSLITNACAITLTKREPVKGVDILCEVGGRSYFRRRESFLCNPYLILNIWATPAEAEVIESLFKRPHTTLKNRARWGLGVVTGANHRYLSTTPREGYVEVVRGVDIQRDGGREFGVGSIRRGGLYMDSNISNYQQVAPIEMYRCSEKLIYKFISSKLRFAVDREGLIPLNSANVLIPNPDFPLSIEQLAQLLNSDFMSWLFRSIFHTRKVLRGDLESLPLFPDYFATHDEFDEKEYAKWLNAEIKG